MTDTYDLTDEICPRCNQPADMTVRRRTAAVYPSDGYTVHEKGNLRYYHRTGADGQ